MSDAEGTRVESSTLTPDWLERLTTYRSARSQQVRQLPRAQGSTAGVARWIAVATRSRAQNERAAEREACWWVASHLAEADRDLELALDHARRALELGGEDAWRMQVSTWLERIGQHREAAAVLAPSVSRVGTAREAARLLVRMARLQLRADEHRLAMQNLLEAATVWPAYAESLDLAGDLAAAKGLAETASMLLEAGDRHDQNGNVVRAFEARYRAFEAAPSSEQACNALCEVLERSERFEAADGVRIAHAAACEPPRTKATHFGRLARALEHNVTVRALAAVVDGALESDTDAEIGRAVEDALSRAGLHDAVMARWELGASRKQGAERARALVELAGLYLGRLAAPDRAVEAWIEALAADPSCGEARAALRTHARSMHDQSAWAEGLIRAVRSNPQGASTVTCLRELAALAEERLSEPSLASWAYEQLEARGAGDDEIHKAKGRLSPRVRLQDSALAAAEKDVEQGDAEARLEGWRRMAAILRGRPDELERYVDVLAKLVRSGHGERRWWVDFERAAVRAGKLDLLEEVTRACLRDDVGRADILHYRTTLVTLAWRRGDAQAALGDARALAQQLPGTRLAHAHAWIAASALGDDEARAEALESLASNQSAAVRATMLALAGEIRRLLHQHDQAARLLDEAAKADASAPRVLRLQAALGVEAPDERYARTVEKLASCYLPSRDHLAASVQAFESIGQHDLAHAWARRWTNLRPWDPQVVDRLVASAASTASTETLVSAVVRATSTPVGFELIEPVVCRGLRLVAERDAARAAVVARDLCDLFGVRQESFRETLLDLARSTGDKRLEARVLERWLACRESPDAPEAWVHLSALYRQLDEVEAAARALCRAAHAKADPAEVLASVDAFGEVPSGDAALSLLEAKAVALDARGSSDQAAAAWLALGSSRWERADDRIGAIAAWVRGLGGPGTTGFARLSESLTAFANAEIALAAIRDFGLTSEDPVQRASALVVAAARSLAVSQFRTALELAMLALREDPRRTDALVIVERASEGAGAPEAVDEAHAVAATGAKGRFGRRAAHFRAARTLEQRNRPELAVVHAMAAFEADPVQGSSLVLMLRLADRVDATEVIETLVRVAENASRSEERAFWWMQAARVAAGRPDHDRRALDLSIRAFSTSPSVEAIELMGEVMGRLVAQDPDDAVIFELRLQRARKAIAPQLEGPVGARVALAAASVAAGVLASASAAMEWMAAALACSGDIDEFDRMVPHVPVLSADERGCFSFIDEVLGRGVGIRGTTGPSLFTFARALARALDDGVREAKLADAQQASEQAQGPSEVDPFADLADELSADSEHPPQEQPAQEQEPESPPAEPAPEPSAGISRFSKTLPPGAMPAVSQPDPTVADPVAAAARLEQQGELSEAIELLEQVQVDASQQPRIDEMLRRLYEASGRNSKLAPVLERIAERTQDPGAKVRLLVEMAALREARGDREAARATWQLVTEVDPSYGDAWVFLERDAGDRGEFAMLAQILARRASVSTSSEELRSLRLRRARVLDDELGLADQARSELDELLGTIGADAEVLRYRAELAERAEGPAGAAAFWTRAAAVVASRNEAVELACRAARAYLDAGQPERARDALTFTGDVATEQVLSLRIETERHFGVTPALGDHLEAWSERSRDDDAQRARALMEAARIARDAGTAERAVDRARRAAKLAPDDAKILLEAVLLTYRLEGLAKREHVVEMLDWLEASRPKTEEQDQDLHAFLTAECLEVLVGPERALEHLHDRKRILGLPPLTALALADRVAAMGDPQAALPLFDVALGAVDLLGVRTRAQVAFAAARAALRAGGSTLAAPYLAAVEKEPGAEEMVARLRKEMAEIVPANDEMRRQLDHLARTSKGVERAHALHRLARLYAARGTRASNAEAEGYYVEAMAAAASDPELRDEIAAERYAFRAKLTPSKLPPPAAEGKVPSVPPPPRAPNFETPKPSPTMVSGAPPLPLSALPSTPPPRTQGASAPPPRPEAREPSLTSTISSQPPPPMPGGQSEATATSSAPPPRTSSSPPPDPELERKLFEALGKGEVDAGDQLASLLNGDPNRSQDVVAIRRRQVVLQPFSIRYLELLRDAARADRNRTHAAAVHHVVCVLTGQPSPVAPELQHQLVDPDRLMAMVGRGVHGAAAEILGAIWQNASHLFSREPATYGLTGLERVALSAPSPVGQAYTTAARALGLGKTPVYQRRTHGPMTLAVAATTPPSVVVTGDVQQGPELLYRMGAMLMATTPANSMLFGLPPNAIKQLMNALFAAFGPPDASRSRVSESAVLAGELWRALPGRVQRRFGELYRQDQPFTYEDAWARALQSTRRAGLFVVGDLRVALEDALADPGVRDKVDVGATDAYRTLCRVSVSAADLVRFASSAEFAEVRWREARRTTSGGMPHVQA